jgi:prevent-host-death family protein
MTSFTASDARTHFAEILATVGHGKDRVLIEKHSRPVAAVIPTEELALLDDLVAAAEDDDRFRERLASLRDARGRSDLLRTMENPSVEIVLTPEEFTAFADRIKYPRPANDELRRLMAADGD